MKKLPCLIILSICVVICYEVNANHSYAMHPIYVADYSKEKFGGIIVQKEGYQKCIDVEEYVMGTLPEAIDMSASMEEIKAQAVLIRSSAFYLHAKKKSAFVNSAELGLTYLDEMQRRQRFKEAYEAVKKKLEEAAEQTRGIVMCYEQKPIVGSFCKMSPGKTKNDLPEYPYFKAVACDKNIVKEGYQQRVEFTTDEKIEIEKVDDEGCVQCVSVNGISISASKFAYDMKLASPYFYENEFDERTYYIKGLGHGYGFDQSYAKDLCEASQIDFMDLLNTFFQGITLEKKIW